MKAYFYFVLIFVALSSCSKNNAPKPEPAKPIDPVVVTPTVTGFTPASAEIGQQVTITGTNFGTDINAVRVYFADGTAVIPKSVSTTQIIVEVPATAISGQIGVSVNNGAQIKSGGVFSFIPPKATMTGFAPLSAKVNEEITITGTNFGTDINKVSIQFANGSIIKPKSVTPTQIKLNLTSAASSGILTVIVDGTILKSANLFTYVETEGIDYIVQILKNGGGTFNYSSAKVITKTFCSNSSSQVIKTNVTGTGSSISIILMNAENAEISNLNDALDVTFLKCTNPYVEYTFWRTDGKIEKKIQIELSYSNAHLIIQGTSADTFKGQSFTANQVKDLIKTDGHKLESFMF